MKKLLLLLIISITIISCTENKSDKTDDVLLTITDDLGEVISFDKYPEKIITLAPNLTEMVFELGCGDKLVGNTKFCNYPEEANNTEKIGDLLTVDYEKIIKIKPDVILQTVEGNKKQVYDKLVSLGFKVFISDPRDYEGIKKSFKQISKLTRKEKVADSLTAEWDIQYNKISSDKSLNGKSAMFLVSVKPIMLAGKNTFINTFMNTLSIRNIADKANQNYPVFSREEILKEDPDYILFPKMGNAGVNELKAAYPEWKNLQAVKNNNVLILDADIYYRPGPRYIKALEDLYKRVNGSFR